MLDARSRRVVPRIIAASAAMGLLLWLMDEACASLYAGAFVQRTLALTVVITVAVAVFFILALLFGAAEWREIKQRFALAGRP
jgi:peptidoglycan biosynthesis protein MviN/MurJ (putative lipid II flippase)